MFVNVVPCRIFSVLSEDATQSQTFEQVATSLHHYFNNKSDYFKVGQALVSTFICVFGLMHAHIFLLFHDMSVCCQPVAIVDMVY